MAKFVCSVCGYTYEGENPPEKCPLCGAPAAKFNKVDASAGMAYADEHRIGVAAGVDAEVLQG